MGFELKILGSNSATPAHGRYMTSQVLNIGEHHFLIDCAEATQMQIQRYKVRFQKINHIFISHLHGDHIFGLPGLLLSMSLNNRQEKLFIFSPPGLKLLLDTVFKVSQSHLSFEIEYIETNPEVSTIILENEQLYVTTIPLKHRIPANGYLFKEKPLPRKMNKELLAKLKIPYQYINLIKMGDGWTDEAGVYYSNQALTEDPAKPKSFAFCSDTAYSEEIIPIIKEVDLLYHEATFMHELLNQAEITGHSTALQAAKIAEAAKVKKLILGHFSSRYINPDCLLEEAKTVFFNTELAIEGGIFSV
jgi:ribonuclease Z